MKIFILMLISFNSFSSEILSFKEINDIKAPKKVRKAKPKNLKDKQKIQELERKLEAYRYVNKMQLRDPIVMNEVLVEEASLVAGKTTQAIYATNTQSRVIISNIKGSMIPANSKIICEVYAKYKRICGSCNRAIINGTGYDIDATLNNKDGSNCAVGEISDDKEKYMTGIFLSEMAQGALAISQSSLPTITGNAIENSARNKISQGLINTGNEATDILKEEYKTAEPIVSLPQFSNVIIQFNSELKIWNILYY